MRRTATNAAGSCAHTNRTRYGKNSSGAAIVYSGLAGTTLLRIGGEAPMDFLGFSVAGPGDLNGDGFLDIREANGGIKQLRL